MTKISKPGGEMRNKRPSSPRRRNTGINNEKYPFAVRLGIGSAAYSALRRTIIKTCKNGSFVQGDAGYDFENTITPFLQSTAIWSLAAKWPSSISLAKGFSICVWIARFNGRAPKTGSNPACANSASAASDT
jgi:hypothetical protein